MRTFAGIAVGFAMVPAVMGMCGLFVWTMMALKISPPDFAIGVISGMGALLIGAAIAFKFIP